MTTPLKAHPAANMLPSMSQRDRERLKADIIENGIRQPIVVHDGQVLDGRHRYGAAIELGIECPMVNYDGDDPVGYVISANLHRRHLTPSQRSRLAADIEELKAVEAKARQTAAQNNDAGRAVRANLPQQSESRARDEAGALLNVSGRSVSNAKKVKDRGSKKLDDALKAGTVSASAAAKAVDTLPEDRQDAAVELVESGEAKNLTEAIRKVAPERDAAVAVRKLGGASPVLRVTEGNDILGYVAKHGDAWRVMTGSYKTQDEALMALREGV